MYCETVDHSYGLGPVENHFEVSYLITHACQAVLMVALSLYWGEPERAPHKRYSRARIVYIIWYVGHVKYMASMALWT